MRDGALVGERGMGLEAESLQACGGDFDLPDHFPVGVLPLRRAAEREARHRRLVGAGRQVGEINRDEGAHTRIVGTTKAVISRRISPHAAAILNGFETRLLPRPPSAHAAQLAERVGALPEAA